MRSYFVCHIDDIDDIQTSVKAVVLPLANKQELGEGEEENGGESGRSHKSLSLPRVQNPRQTTRQDARSAHGFRLRASQLEDDHLRPLE